MKKINKILSFSLVLPLIYSLNIYSSIPSDIIITKDSEYSLCLDYPYNISEKTNIKSVSSSTNALAVEKDNSILLNTSSCGTYNLPVKLFNKIPIKTISVTVTPEKYVIPSGDTIGVKLYTDGLLVVALSDFITDGGKTVSPGKSAGVIEGDRIVTLNGQRIRSVENFSELIKSAFEINLGIMRGTELLDIPVEAIKPFDSDEKKIGIWVRDSTAGIGTLTYFDPENSFFAALGHAICDTDTGEIMTVQKGSILTCDIYSVNKGTEGTPGELVGSFSNTTLGTIKKNNELGIYGILNKDKYIDLYKPVPIATRFQIKEGPATILSNVDGNGAKEYSAEIVKVSKSTKIDNKGLIIKITDPTLLEKTGGIVQGMSGSPILQNDMLVGAVTHVFVNDPTKGYGIFIENMLDEANKIK